MALAVGAQNPRKALSLYRAVKKQNEEFSLLVFLVSLAAPVAAGFLALRLPLGPGWLNTALSCAILAYVGFGLPGIVKALRDRECGVISLFSPEEERHFWINAC